MIWPGDLSFRARSERLEYHESRTEGVYRTARDCRLFPRSGAQSKHGQGQEDGHFLFPVPSLGWDFTANVVPVLEWFHSHSLCGVHLLAGFSHAVRSRSRVSSCRSCRFPRAGRAGPRGDALDGLHRHRERSTR